MFGGSIIVENVVVLFIIINDLSENIFIIEVYDGVMVVMFFIGCGVFVCRNNILFLVNGIYFVVVIIDVGFFSGGIIK